MTIAVLALVLLATFSEPDPASSWRHLSTGRFIAERGLPHQDPFTALGANRPWANSAWLFDLTVYLAHASGGAWGPFLLRSFLASFLALALAGSPRGWHTLAAVIPLPVTVFALRDGLGLTPAFPGVVCAALLTGLIAHADRGAVWSWLFQLFLVQAVWANVDSHFLLGPLLVSSCWAGSFLDRWVYRAAAQANGTEAQHLNISHSRLLALALVVIVLASLVSPFGVSGWRSSWSECSAAFRIDAEGQAMVSGLAPIWSVGWRDPAIAASAILWVAALFGGVWPTLSYRSLLPTMLMGVLVTADMRFMPFAAAWFVRVIQFSFWSQWSSPHAGELGRTRSIGGTTIIALGVFFAIGIATVPFVRRFAGIVERVRRELTSTSTIQARVNWLDSVKLDGVVLTLQPSDAGWLVFGSPRLRPLLDDRIELFGSNYGVYSRLCRDVLNDRHNAYRRTDGSVGGWRRQQNVLPFRWVAGRTADVPTVEQLSSSIFWGPVYWDSEVVVFGMKQDAEVLAVAHHLSEMDRLVRARSSDSDSVPIDLTDAELQRLSPIGVYGLEHSPQEMLGLAKVMMAMNFPHLARSYLSRIHLPALKAERDRLNNLCAMLGAEQIPYTLQDASHE